MDVAALLGALAGHQWMAAAVLLLGWLAAALKPESKFPINVPDRWRPLVVILVGVALAVLAEGPPWPAAIATGLVTATTSMGLFEVTVTAIWGGHLPRALAWLALVDPKLADAARSGAAIQAKLFGAHASKVVLPPSSAQAPP
jgi:hypothetical protein